MHKKRYGKDLFETLIFVDSNPKCKLKDVVEGIGSNYHTAYNRLGDLITMGLVERDYTKRARNTSSYSTTDKGHVASQHASAIMGLIG